jgi:hypothetical protein
MKSDYQTPFADEETTLAPLDLARHEVANVDEGGNRLVSCDERDLVSKGLATPPASIRPT